MVHEEIRSIAPRNGITETRFPNIVFAAFPCSIFNYENGRQIASSGGNTPDEKGETVAVIIVQQQFWYRFP